MSACFLIPTLMFITLCVKDDELYLCFPLWSDSSNILLYHVANVELLQKLGRLQKVLHEFLLLLFMILHFFRAQALP